MSHSHTIIAPCGVVRETPRSRLLPSVMAAQAAIHASIRAHAISENAPTSKRVVGARLRGHDVVDVAVVATFFRLINESLSP